MNKTLAFVAIFASLSVSGTNKGWLRINGGVTDQEGWFDSNPWTLDEPKVLQ